LAQADPAHRCMLMITLSVLVLVVSGETAPRELFAAPAPGLRGAPADARSVVQMLGGPDWDREPERRSRAQLQVPEGWDENGALGAEQPRSGDRRADVQMQVAEAPWGTSSSQKLLPPSKEPWRPWREWRLWKVPAWRIGVAVLLLAALARRVVNPSVTSRLLAGLTYPPAWNPATRELSSGMLELMPAVFAMPQRSRSTEPSVEEAARELSELCRDEESSGCDLAMLDALRSFRTAKEKGYKWPSLAEVAELCRDDESSGCDVDLIRALNVIEARRVKGSPRRGPALAEELCRDEESSGCDLEMLAALEKLEALNQQELPTLAEVQEMCRDEESSGCDVDMLDLLTALESREPDEERGPRARLVDGLRQGWRRVQAVRPRAPQVRMPSNKEPYVRLRPH